MSLIHNERCDNKVFESIMRNSQYIMRTVNEVSVGMSFLLILLALINIVFCGGMQGTMQKKEWG